jgi:hypothetical protein
VSVINAGISSVVATPTGLTLTQKQIERYDMTKFVISLNHPKLSQLQPPELWGGPKNATAFSSRRSPASLP